MRSVFIKLLMLAVITSSAISPAMSKPERRAEGEGRQQASLGSEKAADSTTAAAFDRMRIEGNTAVYNLDYKGARGIFQEMTKMSPDHPAGYVYLANNLWLETLNSNRRLSSSLYSGGSFYVQDAEQDEADLKRDREFNELIKKAVALSKARLQTNPQDVEALYYQASALGLRAGYSLSVNRSFRRSIGDANESVSLQKKVIKLDPTYTDAYLSIGLYEYVVDSLPWIWRTLARLAGIKGSKQKGVEHLLLVTEKGKYTADDARVLLIGLYSRENQPERAFEMINLLADKYPRNYLLGVERAAMLYRMGKAREGDQAFAALLGSEHVAKAAVDLVNYQWGEAMTARGDHASALEKYGEVIRWTRSDKGLVTLAHLRAGQALDVLGKRAEAVAEYQAVMKREKVFDSRKQASEYLKKPYAKTPGGKT
ncbi:MAG TPA: hypothetical protein VNI02_09825 [Blastocatellia bacterium]|nr:hypothetical protein [Blastocatellia bacterium]